MECIQIKPVLITRETIQEMLGGISRTTFWRKRQEWEKAGTPFPDPDPKFTPIKGGARYRYLDVMNFFKDQGLAE